MSRLAVILIAAVLLVLLADRAVEPLLERAASREELSETLDQTGRFLDLLSDARLLVYRTRRRYDALPEPKPVAELRVFVIGNSTALFQIEPAVIRAELARALPGREVRVVPLLLPMLKTADELLLVRAALAKQADVVVATPALRGLEAGDSFLSPLLREAFAADRPPRTGVAALESLLADRLALLRYGGELRAVLLRRFARVLRRGSEAERRRRLDEDLALVTRVARGGDVVELMSVYESRGLSALLRTDLRGDLLSASSPVRSTLEEMANALVGHESRGVAIFMPANPLLRGVGPARQSGQLDDARVRELVDLTLRPFAEAGWQVLDALDALPAEAFVDLVHVHGREYAEAMSIRAAKLVVRALSEAPAAPGARSTPPRPPT